MEAGNSDYFALEPLWMSSDIRDEAVRIDLGPGPTLHIHTPDAEVHSWQWLGFGFKRLIESE